MRIGQVFKSRKFPESNVRFTILDLSENLEHVRFNCTACNLVHEVLASVFKIIALEIKE